MPDQRFPRTARLLNGPAFGRVFAARSTHQNRYFRFHHAPSAEPLARLGLAVSRRLARRAVDRNRLKRLVRESFRHHRLDLPALDFVVIPRSSATRCDAHTVRQALDQLWQRF